MENNNVFLAIRALIAAGVAAFSAAWGWLGWLVVAWVACMVIDWISGSAAAAAKGEWSSSVARAGILHKGGMLLVVVAAALTDAVLSIVVDNMPVIDVHYTVMVLPVILVWYIFTELGSIAENAADMGAPVPVWLTKLLAAGKQAVDNTVDDGESDQ